MIAFWNIQKAAESRGRLMVLVMLLLEGRSEVLGVVVGSFSELPALAEVPKCGAVLEACEQAGRAAQLCPALPVTLPTIAPFKFPEKWRR